MRPSGRHAGAADPITDRVLVCHWIFPSRAIHCGILPSSRLAQPGVICVALFYFVPYIAQVSVPIGPQQASHRMQLTTESCLAEASACPLHDLSNFAIASSGSYISTVPAEPAAAGQDAGNPGPTQSNWDRARFLRPCLTQSTMQIAWYAVHLQDLLCSQASSTWSARE